jgi:hypothetical protein
VLQLIPCTFCNVWKRETQGSKCCRYRPAYTLCGNSHTRAKKTFGVWFTWWIGVAKWLSRVVGDVARGVWPMAAYLQTMVGRGPSPHHLGTSDRIRPRIAWKEKLQEPPYLRLKLTFSCRFSFQLMTSLSGVGKSQTRQAGWQRRNAASSQVLMIYRFGSDQHFLGGHGG